MNEKFDSSFNKGKDLKIGKFYHVLACDCCVSIEFTAKLIEKENTDLDYPDLTFENKDCYNNRIELSNYLCAKFCDSV
jgi:hypothetical protein